jgi:hypothetical protein
MSDDKISLISKDIEFVKNVVQDTSHRLSGLEEATSKFSRDFHEHIATDKQMSHEIMRIGRVLEKNTDSLVEHMRRTQLNEMSIEELKNISVKLDERLQPLESTHMQRRTYFIVIAKIGAILTFAIGLSKFIYDIYISKH